MTNEIDPARWTQSSDDAPEFLRAPFAAAAKEGPSPAQMRMLAIKLAAVSAGAAVAAGASTAQASSTLGGGSAVAGSTLPFAKVIIAVAVVGASALGGVALFSKTSDSRVGAPSAATANRGPAPSDVAEAAPSVNALSPTVKPPPAEPAPVPALVENEAAAPEAVAPVRDTSAKASRAISANAEGAATRTNAKRVTVKSVQGRSVTGVAEEAHESVNKADVPSEVELLRRARTALAARPREAFALTEQHREHYPQGVFAQERDALAIEALLRAGDTDTARKLATRFVSAHPSSPHAHRFRETLGLR